MLAVQTSEMNGKDRSFLFLENNRKGEEDKRQGKQRNVDHLSIVVHVTCLVAEHQSELKDVYTRSISRELSISPQKVYIGSPNESRENFVESMYDLL